MKRPPWYSPTTHGTHPLLVNQEGMGTFPRLCPCAADGGTEGGGAGGAGKAVPESGLSLEHIGKNFSLTEFNCFEGAFEKA